MPRSPHVSQNRRVPYYPRQVVYLEVWPRSADVPREGGGRTGPAFQTYDILDYWRASRYECNADGYHLLCCGRSDRATHWWDWLWERTSHESEPWVFCWCLGTALTLLDTWRRCVVREIQVEAAVIEDPPTLLSIRLAGRRFRMADIRNYWPVDLVKLTGSDRPGPDLEEQLLRCIQAWPRNSLAPWAATAGSLAYGDWMAEPGQEPFIPHQYPLVRAMERAAYKPGRQEVFYVGDVNHPVYKLDANSHYGSVMAAEELPVKLEEVILDGCLPSDLEAIGPHRCLAYVSLDSLGGTFPVRRGRALWHCNGRFRTVLAGPELSRAVRDGAVSSVHAIAVYAMGRPLASYAWHWYGQRLDAIRRGIPSDKLLAKICLNALPGKFAMRTPEWRDRKDVVPPLPFGEFGVWSHKEEKVKRWRSVGWLAQQRLERGEHPDAFPAVSAWIASFGRVRLQEWIDGAGPHNCYYCHTDSVHVNAEGYGRLAAAGHCSQTRLGGLKLDGESPNATYLGCSWYLFAGKWVRCGVPYRHADIGQGMIRFRQGQALRSILQTAHPAELPVREVQLSQSRSQVRGVIGPDGWVGPLALDSAEEPDPVYLALDRLLSS